MSSIYINAIKIRHERASERERERDNAGILETVVEEETKIEFCTGCIDVFGSIMLSYGEIITRHAVQFWVI
jgi:hypothetical protein